MIKRYKLGEGYIWFIDGATSVGVSKRKNYGDLIPLNLKHNIGGWVKGKIIVEITKED
jgi:hypothetical protein